MKKFISFIKNKYVALCTCCGMSLFALAEGEGTNVADTQLTAWVDSAKTTMEGWATKLSPLFTAGIAIILLFVAWKLFKRVTNRAS